MDIMRKLCLAFVGGGFNPRFGGQNIIEPASYGVPVVFGKHMNNFEEESRLLIESGGGIQINNPEELYDALNQLLADQEGTTPSWKESMGNSY